MEGQELPPWNLESTSMSPPPFFASSCVSCPVLLSDAILWTQACLPGRNETTAGEPAARLSHPTLLHASTYLLTSLFSSSNSPTSPTHSRLLTNSHAFSSWCAPSIPAISAPPLPPAPVTHFQMPPPSCPLVSGVKKAESPWNYHKHGGGGAEP